MKRRFLLPLLLLVVLAAGCGGGGGGGAAKLESDDIAVVGDKHIKKSLFDELMHEAQVNLKARGQTFPKAGTTEYSTIKGQAVTILVHQAENEAEAEKLGITILPKDVDKGLTDLKKQLFNGNEKKYQAELKKQGLTEQEVRDNIRANLISQKLYDKVTKDVTVAPTAITAYYVQHQADYQTAESRDVRYILVGKNKKTLADSLFQQLKGGGDTTWCTLAKKYSQDPSSKDNCGKATFSKGQTVPEFDKLTFSLATKEVGKTNSAQYGWFVLQPTAKAKPAKKTPVSEAGKQIKAQLLKEKKDNKMNTWVTETQKSYCGDGKIEYQAGYQPSPDPCVATSTTTSAP